MNTYAWAPASTARSAGERRADVATGLSFVVTVGVGANVIEASWGALVDGLTFGLRRQHR